MPLALSKILSTARGRSECRSTVGYFVVVFTEVVCKVRPPLSVVSSDPEANGTLVTRQFILRFESSGYILVYAEEREWVVQERATKNDITEIPPEAEAEEEIPYDDLCRGCCIARRSTG